MLGDVKLSIRIQHPKSTMQFFKWLLIGIFGFGLRIFIIQTLSKNDNYYEGEFNIFTDLDYKVYLDASLYDSPYQRHTYRYSPLLAIMMAPSYQYHQNFGKWVIAVFDLIAAFLIFKMNVSRKEDYHKTGSLMASFIIFTNPFLVYLSIRGSCEGITISIAYAFLYFYFGGSANGNMSAIERRKQGIIDLQPCRIKRYIAYALYGLWVHFRVFPIIFLPMLIMYQFYSVKENRWRHLFKYLLEFGLISGGVFLGLMLYFYTLYGYEFLHETYFYHLGRRDNRHSRAIVFYEIYLNYAADSNAKSFFRNFMRSFPLYSYVSFFSFYLIKYRSYFYCQGFLTLYFVLFNSVITDQYYFWLFSLLYLVIPELPAYKQKKWGQLYWASFRPMLACLFPVAFWAFFKHHLEHSSKDYTMIHFWAWNIFATTCQVYLITTLVVNRLPITAGSEIQNGEKGKEKVKVKTVKND